MTCNTCSFSWISGLLLFSSDFREDLRKWFLSMETTLYRYRFLLGSSEAKVGFWFLLVLSFSFYLVVHWLYAMLLNWQRALMAEFDLPCKAISRTEFEVIIFQRSIVNMWSRFYWFLANTWKYMQMIDKNLHTSLNLFCVWKMRRMSFSDVPTILQCLLWHVFPHRM